jgi:hypothetical protein
MARCPSLICSTFGLQAVPGRPERRFLVAPGEPRSSLRLQRYMMLHVLYSSIFLEVDHQATPSASPVICSKFCFVRVSPA